MFNIGLGEMVLLVLIGLLVFGPEKLPKAIADGMRMVRQLRDLAANARRDLSDAAGIDLESANGLVNDLRDLHPRRLVGGLLDDVNTATAPSLDVVRSQGDLIRRTTQTAGTAIPSTSNGTSAVQAPHPGTAAPTAPASGAVPPPGHAADAVGRPGYDPDVT